MLGSHSIQHEISSSQCRARMQAGRIHRRIAGQSRDHGAFLDREILRLFPEIIVRGRSHTEHAGPHVVQIAVKCEDLLFGILFFNLPGNQQFFDLAVRCLFIITEEHARQLLRNRAGPFGPAHFDDVFVNSPDVGKIIDPGMVVELIILGGDNGELEVRGDLLEWNDDPSFNEQLADDLIVIRVNVGNDIRPEIFEALDFRQVVFVSPQYAEACSDHDEENNQQAVKNPKPDRQPVRPLSGRQFAS